MIVETIFNQLLNNQKYFNIVYPHLHSRLFVEVNLQTVFNKIKSYTEQYSKQPNVKDITLLISTDQNITVDKTNTIEKLLKDIKKIDAPDNIELSAEFQHR